MKTFLRFALFCLLLFAAATTACGNVPFIAAEPTAPPTRTPRPTFTPLPEFTDTPAVPPTRAATATSAATNTVAAPATTAPEPTNTAAPKAPTQPPRPVNTQPPPAPTKPPLPMALSETPTPCDQEGSFSEIMVDVRNRVPPRTLTTGLYFAVFDGSGKLLTDYNGKPYVGVTDDGRASSGYAWGSDCRRSSDALSPVRFNGKVEVGDAVRAGVDRMVFRFIKGPTDYTPQSADVNLEFPKGIARRWWLNFFSP